MSNGGAKAPMWKINDSLEWQLSPALDATTLALPIFTIVLADFGERNISYCYWKSTRRVRSALAGEQDLDILVARQDQHRAETVILARGFKLFPAVANRDHPSLLSFLGYDESASRLVHLHLHIRLIVGEPLLKNYRLPWEDLVLASAVRHPALPIRVLDPATEALLLAVRGCLELSRLDPVTLRNWRAVTCKFTLDRVDVASRVDRGALRDLAATLLGDDLAAMVVAAVCGEEHFERQRRFRRRMTRQLAVYRTYNGFEARLRAAWRALLWAAGKLNRHVFHLPRPWSRRAPGGGCVAAIVGVDGSGKTTVTAAIREWLGSEIDVVPIYFGTGAGRPSLLLRPFKLLLPLMTHVLKTKPKGASHGTVSDRPPGRIYSVLMMGWATIVAHEKRGKLVSARRGADRGMVVVTDRFPQDEIAGFNDGPLLTRLTNVPRWLRRFEAATYALARRLPPDLVIKLDVVPETAAKREPDMDPGVIGRRIEDLRRLTFASGRVITIDGEQPLKDVIRAVKREIWHLL